VSRSSSALLLVAALLLAVGRAGAQTVPVTALLEVGPQERRGIDALAPDVTPHWYGRYRVGSARVELRFIGSSLPRAANWPPAGCETRPLRSGGGELRYYEHPAGWSLLVDVTSGTLPPSVTLCRFVDRFVERHLLFENLEALTIPGRAPVFPAVIEL
jgi:hypothetical protein